MKQIFVGLFFLLTYGLAAADSFPTPFTAEYKLYAEGFPVGKGTRSLTQLPNGEFLFKTIAETTGFVAFFKKIRIVERSKFTRVKGKISPLEYTYRQSGHKARENRLFFNWSQKRALNQFKGQTKKISLKAGVLDRLLYQLVLMIDLKQGKRQLQYTVANKGKLKKYKPKFLGYEYIKTGLGKLKTVKYERQSSNNKRRTTLWCAPVLHYLPVQVKHIESNGDEFSMVLQTVQGL